MITAPPPRMDTKVFQVRASAYNRTRYYSTMRTANDFIIKSILQDEYITRQHALKRGKKRHWRTSHLVRNVG